MTKKGKNWTSQAILKSARSTLATEAAAIAHLSTLVDKSFVHAVQAMYACTGRVVVTGMGKSALVAQKMVATFNSTGTAALFMHAADAIHGDLGMIQKEDVVLCVSKSGESPEIRVLIPLVKHLGNRIIALVGNMQSFLARQADIVLNTTVRREACPNNLAPTSSSTAQMVMGDALAICLLQMRGFTEADFARVHPGGALGKKLYLKVSDLIGPHATPPVVLPTDNINRVILEITTGRLGATAVVDKKGTLKGIITDGDLRRMMESHANYQHLTAAQIMTSRPKTIEADQLAVVALDLMRQHKITQVVVTRRGRYCGMVHVHDLLREGLL